MNSALVRDLRRITNRIAAESKNFATSADLVSPSAVYAVENLRGLRQKLDEQLTVIAHHQAKAAGMDMGDPEDDDQTHGYE